MKTDIGERNPKFAFFVKELQVGYAGEKAFWGYFEKPIIIPQYHLKISFFHAT